MRVWQAATGLVVLGVLTGLVAVPMAVGANLAPAGGAAAAPQAESGMGMQVSSFMQSTAVDADSSVDRGMWQASVNESEPEQAVDQRAAALEQRRQALEREMARLEAMHENGTIPEPAYNARASALRARMVNLQSDIDHARQTADSHGVNATELERLRADAANMTGPAVAALAQNITDAPRGPPDGVGPDSRGGNGTGQQAGGGPPDDRDARSNGGQGEGNGPSGSSDDAGNSGQGNGSSDSAGESGQSGDAGGDDSA